MIFIDYWKRSCFELFGDGKYGLFWVNVGGKMIFTGYGEIIVLNFSEMGNTVFLTAKNLMERWYLTWFFWAFYDIPRPGKYGFLRSVVSLGGCTCDALAPHFHQNLFWYFIWYLWIHFTQCSNISFTGFQDANTSWAIFLLCLISRYVEANLRRSNKHRRYNLPLPELFCIIYLIHLQNVMSQKLN